jgi:RecA-family ATPase
MAKMAAGKYGGGFGHFGWYAGNELGGQNLDRLSIAGADDAGVQRLSFLNTTERNASVLDKSGFEALESALESLRPDLLVLDPLVTFCGGGNMNDNSVMSQVMRELKRMAAKFDCAILIVHHTRKSADKKGTDDGNAEAVSGAAAIVNLARRAIMPVPMAKDEAVENCVSPLQRFRYFKLVDAKSNFAPRATDSPW